MTSAGFKAFGALTIALCILASRLDADQARPAPNTAEPALVTFNKDIAPLVFDRCARCHHPGGLAPFSMLTYASVRQHASQIAAVTKNRIMPPWRAESDYGGFLDQHPLSDAEVDLIQRWVSQGAVEGDTRDLPPAPAIVEGWQLGEPDLVVKLPEPYTLGAEGTDVFRLFVIPLPVDRAHYVRGLEFRPSNARVVHHANIRIDRTRTSRNLDEEDPTLGYDGLIARTAAYPDGHFLGWTPGQVPPLLPKGLSWHLEPETDLVVEIHMQPSGKPELVQPSIGFYFGDDPPDRTPMMLRLGRQNIDIPPGESNHTVTDSFLLPVDLEVQAVQPHAHYTLREAIGTATLPDGTTNTIIHIKDWDFRWQHVYRFITPFALPKGTTIAMRYTYDNSADNPRNPSHPPRRILWGQRSADEMGDMWFQILTKDVQDYDTLNAQFRPKVLAEDIIGYTGVLEAEPNSVALHDDIASMYLELGQPDRAAAYFRGSARLQPESPAAHFNLGLALLAGGEIAEAITEYQRALELDPDYARAHNNLAAIFFQQGNLDDALVHFRDAVRVDPNLAEAHRNIGRLLLERGEEPGAIEHLRQAVSAEPEWAAAAADLAWMLATASDDRLLDPDLAVRLAVQTVELTGGRDPGALIILAAAYAAAGQFGRAIETTETALRLEPGGSVAASILQHQELYRQQKAYRRAPILHKTGQRTP